MTRRLACLSSAVRCDDGQGAKGDDRERKRGRACELKVVMTGSAEDGPEWQKHIGNKQRRRELANQLTHPPPHGGFALRAAYGSLSRLPPVGSAQGRKEPLQDRDRARHVADRL